jgi:hypothetical protein
MPTHWNTLTLYLVQQTAAQSNAMHCRQQGRQQEASLKVISTKHSIYSQTRHAG